jgi:Domain of unknown function (DU1801)
MAANKTTQTSAYVDAFIKAITNETQCADAVTLCALIEQLSGEPPRMWGPSIIGFGSYHYKYESGREGDSLRIGFSPRKGKTVLYIVNGFAGHAELLARLGKHKTGKSCLYIKRLADVDMAVLEAMIKSSLRYMATVYP